MKDGDDIAWVWNLKMAFHVDSIDFPYGSESSSQEPHLPHSADEEPEAGGSYLFEGTKPCQAWLL